MRALEVKSVAFISKVENKSLDFHRFGGSMILFLGLSMALGFSKDEIFFLRILDVTVIQNIMTLRSDDRE